MKTLMKRTACAVLACLAVSAGPAFAQAYPSKPIQIVLGFPPGGSTDILARLVAQKLQEDWGQPVVVINKPGASTIIATESVVKSPADGYTLLIGASSGLTINPVLYDKLPYHPTRDLMPITIMGSFPLLLIVQPNMPVNSVKELISYAKTASPSLNYSSASTLFQLSGEMFKQMASVDVTHIPYKGSMQAVTALATGDVQMLFLDPAPALVQMKAGKAKALAVTSKKRWSLMPDLPSLAESGLPDYDVTGWIGLFAPTGTPPDIVAKVQKEVSRVVALPEMRERLETLGIDAGGKALGISDADNNPEQLANVIKNEAVRFTKVIKTANIKAE
jgi:tripartite-type tricarboxylate transporter receptor subunit TctC